jgi:hypothetical protein
MVEDHQGTTTGDHLKHKIPEPLSEVEREFIF